jgi:hypothetical protein
MDAWRPKRAEDLRHNQMTMKVKVYWVGYVIVIVESSWYYIYVTISNFMWPALLVFVEFLVMFKIILIESIIVLWLCHQREVWPAGFM